MIQPHRGNMKDLKEMTLRELVDGIAYTREEYVNGVPLGTYVRELLGRLRVLEAAVEGMDCVSTYVDGLNTTKATRLWENLLDAEAAYSAVKEAERNVE